MEFNYKRHLICTGSSIKNALEILNKLGSDAILFIVKEDGVLIGSLTDGDVRRGLLNGYLLTDSVDKFIQTNPKFITKGEYDIEQIVFFREKGYKIIPVLDKKGIIVNIINFRYIKSYLPVDTVIMAGGRGERLRPLTDNLPKPLLKVGDKPIIQHNLDRLSLFGINNFWITLRYLGSHIEKQFQNYKEETTINFIYENEPLGTIGAVSQINNFTHDYLIITNSDILTNIDYEHFFIDFINKNADFSVVTIPYTVEVPYAVLETENENIVNFREKPTYTYYSNGGIYLMKKNVIRYIPDYTFFNATDLMEKLISIGKKVISYPLPGYWLDIGRHEDYEKAQRDINMINF